MLKIFKRKKADPMSELQKVLGEAELPSFPAAIMNALQKVRENDVELGEVADAVATDPGLSTRLLGTVNSAAYSLRHKVRSIHHAVTILGRNELESMLISMGVRETIPRTPVRGFESERFWVAAARRAAAARALADRIDPRTGSEAFTAALLQDMALPLLAHSRTDEYGPVLEQWHGSHEDLAVLERQSFAWDHAEVATWMCARWKFPELMTQAIHVHHGTGTEDEPGIAAVNLVAPLHEVDEAVGIERLIETAHESYGLPKDETVSLVGESFEAAREIAKLFI